MTTVRLLAAVAALALATSACSADDIAKSAAEKAMEQAGGGDVNIDTDNGTVSMTSSEGTVQMGGGSLPEAFPDDMPLPEGDYEVASSFSQEGSDGLQMQVALQVQASVDELSGYFEQALPKQGWEIVDTRRQSMDGLESVTYSIKHEDGRGGIVTITHADDDPTLVNYGIGTTD